MENHRLPDAILGTNALRVSSGYVLDIDPSARNSQLLGVHSQVHQFVGFYLSEGQNDIASVKQFDLRALHVVARYFVILLLAEVCTGRGNHGNVATASFGNAGAHKIIERKWTNVNYVRTCCSQRFSKPQHSKSWAGILCTQAPIRHKAENPCSSSAPATVTDGKAMDFNRVIGL